MSDWHDQDYYRGRNRDGFFNNRRGDHDTDGRYVDEIVESALTASTWLTPKARTTNETEHVFYRKGDKLHESWYAKRSQMWRHQDLSTAEGFLAAQGNPSALAANRVRQYLFYRGKTDDKICFVHFESEPPWKCKQIANSSSGASDPVGCLEPDGTATHVLYVVQDGKVHHIAQQSAPVNDITTWSAPATISHAPTQTAETRVAYAVDKVSGILHLFYVNIDGKLSELQLNNQGVWSSAADNRIDLYSDSYTLAKGRPAAAVFNGKLHLVYLASNGTYHYFRRSLEADNWEYVDSLGIPTANGTPSNPDICVWNQHRRENEKLYLVYRSGNRIYESTLARSDRATWEHNRTPLDDVDHEEFDEHDNPGVAVPNAKPTEDPLIYQWTFDSNEHTLHVVYVDANHKIREFWQPHPDVSFSGFPDL